jgi:hypothetical protein
MIKQYITATLLLITIITLGYSADSNGIWHNSEDIRPGIFGADEGISTGFSFINPVSLNEDVLYKGTLIEDIFVKTNQSNSITSDMIVNGTIISADLNIEEIKPIINYWTKTGANLYDTSSNVGIGTPNPSYKLHVIGDMGFTGTLQQGSVPWAMLINNPSITAGTGLSGGGILSTTRTIGINTQAINTCSGANQKIIWDSTNNRFACATDMVNSGTITQINTGTGITGGPITSSGTIALDVAYTDARYVRKTGDTMTGNLNMGGLRVRNVANPAVATDVATKSYVDTAISSSGSGTAKYVSGSSPACPSGTTIIMRYYQYNCGGYEYSTTCMQACKSTWMTPPDIYSCNWQDNVGQNHVTSATTWTKALCG